MSTPETHYILIVHGTWAPPKPGVIKWYQKCGEFARDLAQRLEDTAAAGSVWRSCAGDPTDYSWSGSNTHVARLTAAKCLCDRITTIRNNDETARIHIIAHSHGGNVLLKALESYFSEVLTEGNPSGTARRLHEDISRHPNVSNKDDLAVAVTAALTDIHPTWPQVRRDALTNAIAKNFPQLKLGKTPDPILQRVNNLDRRVQRIIARRYRDKPQSRRRYSRFAAAAANVTARLVNNVDLHLEQIIAQWCRSNPQSHRIGRLIFLGTPFLHKRWYRQGWRSGLQAFLNVTAGFVYILILVYFFIMIGAALSAFKSDAEFIGFNPLSWPTWLEVGYILSAFVGSIINVASAGKQRRDVNLYHIPPVALYRVPSLQIDPFATPVEALVVTAGQLDEALLGLSAEPLAVSYLRPEIDKLVSWRFNWRLSQLPSGVDFVLYFTSIQRAFAWLILVARNLLKLLLWPIYASILRPLSRAYLWNSLRRLLLAQATGLSPHEFNAASLAVRAEIGVPEVFDEGTAWNIAELIAGEPSVLPYPVERQRYAFLWSGEALTTRMSQSLIWPQIMCREPTLERTRGYPLEHEESLSLKRACVVLEEKASELGGAVHLAHSGYYGHRTVMDAIVAFLLKGQRPTVTDCLTLGLTPSDR
jgi:hypothetical protein